MKIRGNRLIRMALVWGFVPLLIGPSRATATGPEFDKIVDDYVASRFAYRPSEGTAAGLHEYDDQLEDLSRRARCGGSTNCTSSSSGFSR